MSHITERIHPRMSFLHASFLLAVMIAMVSRAAFGQANAAGYTWSNVYTGGGGGYIPNIIFNPSQQNLIYARTDIGGAYKWNSTTNLWVPLMDWVTWANWNEPRPISTTRPTAVRAGLMSPPRFVSAGRPVIETVQPTW